MEAGEQCQICGNDYDPMRSCVCRWAPLRGDDRYELTEARKMASTSEAAAAIAWAQDEIERMRSRLQEIKLLTQAYAEDYDGWPMVANIHRVARVGLGETS